MIIEQQQENKAQMKMNTKIQEIIEENKVRMRMNTKVQEAIEENKVRMKMSTKVQEAIEETKAQRMSTKIEEIIEETKDQMEMIDKLGRRSITLVVVMKKILIRLEDMKRILKAILSKLIEIGNIHKNKNPLIPMNGTMLLSQINPRIICNLKKEN